MLAASMTTSTEDSSTRCATWMLPRKLVNRPCTRESPMCRATNRIDVWSGSSTHSPGSGSRRLTSGSNSTSPSAVWSPLTTSTL